MIMLKFGDVVYHVANPTVKGIVIHPNGYEKDFIPTVGVKFEKPVSFSMNQGYCRFDWICSANLLYSSPEEAKRNNVPELADPERYRKFIQKKFG